MSSPPTTTKKDPTKKTAFISGPLEVSSSYFSRYYIPSLNQAISQSHDFVLGPVSGIDSLALDYLLATIPSSSPSKITVYLAGFEAASRPSFISHLQSLSPLARMEVIEDATTTWDRDWAMTRDSDYDVLRYRTEEEQKGIYGREGRWRARVSNTERNERRRGRFRGGDFRKEEEGGKEFGRYVRHWCENEGKDMVGGDGEEERKEEGEVCDGKCHGHRDVVISEGGVETFGFGNEGVRRF